MSHCNVPAEDKFDGYALGKWCSVQRGTKNKGFLSEERVKRLEGLGFIFDPHAQIEKWEEAFLSLEAYKEVNGDCLVTQGHQTQRDYKLGTWVVTQRRAKDTMSKERKQRLDDIGFDW